MNKHPITILPFDCVNASNREYEDINHFLNLIQAEYLPDDPPTSLQARIDRFQNVSDTNVLKAWLAVDSQGEVVAYASLAFETSGENTHIARVNVDVHPDHRRHGMGREMFRQAVETSQGVGHRWINMKVFENVPGSVAFLERIGAQRGLEARDYQLRLANIDANQLSGVKHASNTFTLGFWDGPYPEDQIAEIAQLQDIMNTEPHGDLAVEDVHTTSEELRKIERTHAALGTQRWSLYVQETATGRFAGLSEVLWRLSRPEIVTQKITAVLPQLQGHGLGRRLKLTMLDRILRERPEAHFLRTGMADSNTAMLAINLSLGFQPYSAFCIWQVSMDQALAYLANRSSQV
jgi:mycothiol synthase